MMYECQGCYAKLEATEIIKSSQGELLCPECGSEVEPLGQSESDNQGSDDLDFEGQVFQDSEFEDSSENTSFGIDED